MYYSNFDASYKLISIPSSDHFFTVCQASVVLQRMPKHVSIKNFMLYTYFHAPQVPTTLMPETKFYLFLSASGETQPSKELVVATVPNLIFVQTDRGIYKPSTAQEDIKGEFINIVLVQLGLCQTCLETTLLVFPFVTF